MDRNDWEKKNDAVLAWRIQDEQRLAECDSELWRETAQGMRPVLAFTPEIIRSCYPTLWSMLN